MKKIFAIFALSALALASACAKKWTNNVGVGFTLPISQIGVDESGADDVFQIGYGIEGTYVGIHESGFTAKADLGAGLATSKDISIQGDKTNLGGFYNIALGAGYSFVNTEKLTFGLTGMLGFDLATYSDSEDDITYDEKKCESVDHTLSYGIFSVGADLFVSYRIKEHFGFFANLSARYLAVGGTTDEIEWTWKDSNGRKRKDSSEGDGSDLAGKFRIQPTIGVVWNF